MAAGGHGAGVGGLHMAAAVQDSQWWWRPPHASFPIHVRPAGWCPCGLQRGATALTPPLLGGDSVGWWVLALSPPVMRTL